MLDLKTATDVQGKVIELQSVILNAQSSALAAQSEQFISLQRISELEKRIAQIEAWDAETGRYQLRDYGRGRFAYELKVDSANGEPTHRLCAACFRWGKNPSFSSSTAVTIVGKTITTARGVTPTSASEVRSI